MSAMDDLDYLFLDEMVRDLDDEEIDLIYTALDGSVRMADQLRVVVPDAFINKFLDLIDAYGTTTVGTAFLDVCDELENQEDTSGAGTFVFDSNAQHRRDELKKIYIEG